MEMERQGETGTRGRQWKRDVVERREREDETEDEDERPAIEKERGRRRGREYSRCK